MNSRLDSNAKTLEIHSLGEMESFGYRLGCLLEGGEVITLNGDLGAGKTSLTKAIAKGLGIDEHITSPTFTIVNEYEGRLKLYHFDVYRLESPEEMYDLGYEEYFYSDGVSVVEWAEIIYSVLPEEKLELYIHRGESDEERTVKLVSYGKKYEKLVEELVK